MKTKLLCILGSLLLLSALFCSCEKEPEASVLYYTSYWAGVAEGSVLPLLNPLEDTPLDTRYKQFQNDLNRLSKRHEWEKTATKGHLSDVDEDAIAEFNDRLLPEVEELISTYQEKFNALEFPDGEFLRLNVHCSLYKKIKIADIDRYFSYIAEHEFELKTN